MLRGTRWSVNDAYNPNNDTLFFGRRLLINERVSDQTLESHEAKTGLSVWDTVKCFLPIHMENISHVALPLQIFQYNTLSPRHHQSIALAKYFEAAEEDFPAESWKTKRVIELGAGCGLVGIVLALQGSPPLSIPLVPSCHVHAVGLQAATCHCASLQTLID